MRFKYAKCDKLSERRQIGLALCTVPYIWHPPPAIDVGLHLPSQEETFRDK